MGMTPNFSLPYPGPFDPINVNQFANLALAVDDAMQGQYDLLTADGLNPTTYVSVGAQAVTANVALINSFTTVGFDNTFSQIWSATNPTTFNMAPGLWRVMALTHMTGTTVTSQFLSVLQNGSSAQLSKRVDQVGSSAVTYAMVSGYLYYASQGTATLQTLYTGTGTGTATLTWMAATRVAGP